MNKLQILDNDVLSEHGLIRFPLASTFFLLVSLVKIHLSIVDASEMSCRIFRFLHDVPLFLHLALILELINHIPEGHSIVRVHLIGQSVLTLRIIVFLRGCQHLLVVIGSVLSVFHGDPSSSILGVCIFGCLS